jgi:GlpG protein
VPASTLATVLRLTGCDGREVADALADRLLVAGIDAEVRGDGPWEVWVIEEDDLARAEAIRAVPESADERRASRAKAKTIRARRTAADAGAASRFVAVRDGWNPVEEIGLQPVTAALILCSLAVAWLTKLGDPSIVALQQLSIEPWDSREFLGHVRRGEVWRLFTPMFIHFGLFHLVFNMLWMRRLGPQVEVHHGMPVMIAVVLVSELLGSLAQYALVGPTFGGMSGVVYGLFGFVWMHARFGRSGTYVLSDRDVVLSMLWFVACATGWLGPVANLGHAGGLVAGLLCGLPPYLRHLRDRRSSLATVEHSWAQTQGTGWQRFRRRVLMPYMPVWLLALAAVVSAVELS